ncbi:MAG: hypothetical protein HY303_13070 [Candidatus Wallbacteria bacterium]|nr:hypothetical protein [Candidatus Wallbacteria bacterium]
MYWSTTSREAVSWTTPVAVGQAFSAKERVLLAAPPGRSASHDRLLAVWRLPSQGPPGTAWLGPRPGVCLQVPGPAGTQGHGRVAAAILPNRESLLVWEYDNSRGGNWALLTSRAEAAAKSWFPAEPLRVESQGYDRIYPVLAVDGDRVWLQWAENRLPGHPLVVGISADGGRSFTGVGRVIWPYNKDPDSALMAAGRWVFSVASLPWPPRRVWSLSSDGGRHWTVPATVSSGDQERTAAVLLPADAGGAWLLFSDPAGQVRFARLP